MILPSPRPFSSHRIVLVVLIALAGFAAAKPQPASGVTILIDAMPGLSSNQAALDAFERAAQQWEGYLTDSTTVRIRADLKNLNDPNVIGQTSSELVTYTYSTVRNSLINDSAAETDDNIVASLPTALTAILPPGGNLSTTAVLTRANAKAIGLIGANPPLRDATIQFNSQFSFDYFNGDGVSGSMMDFETVAAHEIGHALGFVSEVDRVDAQVAAGSSSFTVFTSPLDFYRFVPFGANDPESAADFSTFPRLLTPGTVATFDSVEIPLEWEINAEQQLSTGYSAGDGRQASHWKDNNLSGTLIGIMDPTLSFGQIVPVRRTDLRVMDLIGWDVAPPSSVHQWNPTTAGDYWGTSSNWDLPGIPDVDWHAQLLNSSAAGGLTANVAVSSTVDTVAISGDVGTMTVDVHSGITFTASTSLQVGSLGRLAVRGSVITPALAIATGGELSGNGLVIGATQNAGTVAPGVSTGILTLTGNYTQTPTGKLATEISGTTAGVDHDLLVVSGSATLDGDLELTLLSPYNPSIGDSYLVINAASISGAFATTSNVVIDQTRGLAVLYHPASVSVRTTLRGDIDLDDDVDTADLTVGFQQFSGDGGTGKLWIHGDSDGDGDVDTSDLTLAFQNFTGATAGLTGNPDLIYDPATGNVRIDPDGVSIGSFNLQSAGLFIPPADFSDLSADTGFPSGPTDNTPSAVGWVSGGSLFGVGFDGPGLADLGNIFPTGLDVAGLAALLTNKAWAAPIGGGPGGDFDLFVQQVPEPSGLVLLVLGFAGLCGWRKSRK